MLPDPRPPIEYATKADLRELRQELRADFAEFKLQVLEQFSAFDTRQHERDSALHKTILTTLIAMTAIFGTLVTILKLFA